jgi:hypothetical protein
MTPVAVAITPTVTTPSPVTCNGTDGIYVLLMQIGQATLMNATVYLYKLLLLILPFQTNGSSTVLLSE